MVYILPNPVQKLWQKMKENTSTAVQSFIVPRSKSNCCFKYLHSIYLHNTSEKLLIYSRFTLTKEHLVEFNQLAMANADGLEHMLNRVMPKDNIGLAALLQTTEAAWENGIYICITVLQCTIFKCILF